MTTPALPPDAADLVTLATAYACLGLTSGSDDLRLQLAITATSQRIATWCSRAFQAQIYTETCDGTGTNRLVLRQYPVTAVASVQVSGRAIPARQGGTGYGFACDGRRTLILFGDVFPREPLSVAVTYAAGYATIPADLQLACLEWLKVGYLSQDRAVDLVMKRAGDHEERFSSTAATTQTGSGPVPMPPSVYAVLSQYQNVVPA